MSAEEDPEFVRMTIPLLKSWLTEHNVALPPQNEKKSYYVQLATQTKKRLAAAPAAVPPKSPRPGNKRVRPDAPTPTPAVTEKQAELTSQIKKRKPAASSASVDLGKRHGLDDQADREDGEVEGKKAASKRRHTLGGGEEKKEATPAANRRAAANADATPARPTRHHAETPAATSFKVSLPVSPAPGSPVRASTPPVNEFQSPMRQAAESASPKRQSTSASRKASPKQVAPGGGSTPRKLSYEPDHGRGLAPAAPAPRPAPLRADQLPEVPGARLEPRLAPKPAAAAAPAKRAPAKAPAKPKGPPFSAQLSLAASRALATMAPFIKYGLVLITCVVIASMAKEQLSPTIVFCDDALPRADCTPCPAHGTCSNGVLTCDPLFERDGWFGKGVECKPNSQLKYFQQKVYEVAVTKAGLDVCAEYAKKENPASNKDVSIADIKAELASDRHLTPELQSLAWSAPAKYLVSGGLEITPSGHEIRVWRSQFVYPLSCTIQMWITDHLPEILATVASTLVCLVLVWKRLQHRSLLNNATDIATRIKGILQEQRAQSEFNAQVGAAVPKDQLRSQLVHDHSVADDDALWKEIDRILSRDARLETVSIPLNGRQTDAYMWSAAVPAGAPKVNAGAGFSWS